jgi:plasmid stabilization system protein ParE
MLGRFGSVEETRELVVAGTPYIVVYRVTRRVEILRIRHGAQRWP